VVAYPTAVLVVAQLDRQEAGVARGFRQAVTVQDAQSELLLEALGQRNGQRASAADEVAEVPEVVSANVLAGLQQELENRRHDADDVHVLLGQPPPEGRGF